jgi:hypothetical protein
VHICWHTVGKALSGSVAAITALIVAYIAVAQFFINRRQYRLALFEKRMVVFNSTMNMIASVLTSMKPTLDQCVQYMRETRDHELLFGPEVGDFINEVYKKAVALLTYNSVGVNAAKQQEEVVEWFNQQMGEARKVFLRYLDFRKP